MQASATAPSAHKVCRLKTGRGAPKNQANKGNKIKYSRQKLDTNKLRYITAGQGLEPQYSPPEGDVLPLDEPAIIFTQ